MSFSSLAIPVAVVGTCCCKNSSKILPDLSGEGPIGRLRCARCQCSVRDELTRRTRASLPGSLTLLRRHNRSGKLCDACGNDDAKNLTVTSIDAYGFITSVACKCGMPSRDADGRLERMEVVCRNAGHKLERIYDPERELKRGDHVCWHRIQGYWHHAVVLSVGREQMTVMDYAPAPAVGCCGGLKPIFSSKSYSYTDKNNACVYRVSYDDCFTDEYAIERANALNAELEYNLFKRNCEHSIRWCKTGQTRSEQVSLCGRSLGRMTVVLLLRMLGLFVIGAVELGLEYDAKLHDALKAIERYLQSTLMLAFTAFFICYLARQEFIHARQVFQSHAAAAAEDGEDKGDEDVERCCCSSNAFRRFLRRAFQYALAVVCCCRDRILYGRRQPNVVYGAVVLVLVRITVRELIAVVGPLFIFCYEDKIFLPGVGDSTSFGRMIVVVLLATLANIGFYGVGAVVGRLAELGLRCEQQRCGRCFFATSSDPCKAAYESRRFGRYV